MEYSFPHYYHDELEGALMGDNQGDESCSSREDSDEESRELVAGQHSRGCSPACDTVYGAAKVEKAFSPIVAIPTNGKGCVVIRKNGAFDVVGELPGKLHKKLFQEPTLPVKIELGTLGRYYVQFDDGSYFFCGHPTLSQILIKKAKKLCNNKGGKNQVPIVSLAFGKKLDDYFIVRSNGTWECHGQMPPGLERLLSDREDRADLLWVALGVNGEWCVRAKNGTLWWGDVSEEADELLSNIAAGKNEVTYIDFGVGDTYFVLHG